MDVFTQAWLKGKKTYLAAALAAFVAFNSVAGVVSEELQNAILAAAAALGLYGLRSAIGRQDTHAEEPPAAKSHGDGPRHVLPFPHGSSDRKPPQGGSGTAPPRLTMLLVALALAAGPGRVVGQAFQPDKRCGDCGCPCASGKRCTCAVCECERYGLCPGRRAQPLRSTGGPPVRPVRTTSGQASRLSYD